MQVLSPVAHRSLAWEALILMSVFNPRPYQKLILDFIRDNPRCNVFASPGMGKTSSSLAAFSELQLFGEVNKALVLAPKRVALTSWPDEVQKFKSSFGHLKIAAAIGTPAQRLAALHSEHDVLTINYENIPWLIEQCGENWPYDMIIADEVSRVRGLRVSLQQRKRKDGTLGKAFIAGQGASRAASLARVAHTKVKRWVGLTGSPAPNGLQCLWAIQWFVDAGKRLGTSYSAFTQRWFRPAWGSTPEQQRFEPLPHAQAEIQRLLRECSITVDAKDWFDIKAPVEQHIEIDLPPTARKQYEEMERELFTYIDEHPLEVFNAGSRTLKLLQLASGSVIVDDKGSWSAVHDQKLQALESLVEELAGENVLVAYQFRADAERILKAFPFARMLDSNPQTVRDFQQGKIRMLLAHPKSAGHGLDLQHSCRVLIDYSSGWNLEEDEQIIERIGPTRQAQIGKDVAVLRYRIVARGTIEQTAVLPALQRKMSVQDALKAAMKISR